MSNQIILSALQSKLETAKQALETYQKEVLDPAMEAKRVEVLQWFRDNVTPLVSNLFINAHRVEIPKTESPNSSWGSLTVSLDSNWRSKEEEKYFAKMNWYGSSATIKDENTLMDVQIFGAVAFRLGLIEYEFLNAWKPAIVEIEKPYNDLEIEYNQIERAIRSTEQDIKNEALQKYREPGFETTITKSLDVVRDWNAEKGNVYILEERSAPVQLSTGRSRYDYVYPESFKVIKSNKYKTTLEVKYSTNVVREYTVSENSYSAFISDLYNWETISVKENHEKMTKRFETWNKEK